jgi:ADP-ribosylglycohydrolase
MAESFDRCENVMLGHALANGCQASTHLALLLSKSLCKSKKFDPSDVMSRYLYLYHDSKCNIGEATKLVYEELKASLTTTSDTLTRKHFIFPMEKIYNASHSAHDKLKGLSAGCNPAQRSFPLAFCPWINDENLFQLSCDEARLTHFSNIAGQVSGLINLICRRLLKGDQWNDAVKTGFATAPNLLGEIREIQTRYEHDAVLKSQGHSAYAPNAFHTSLYCVTHADSFENALESAKKIEKNHCPTLVGILAGTRWVVPQSMLINSQKDTLDEIHKVAKCFSDEWDTINGKKKSFLKKIWS